MILNHFRAWASRAPSESRAQGVNALARAYLTSKLGDDERRDALALLTGFLDDPSPLVRTALAQAFATTTDAPHHLVLALADDQASIAAIVLKSSPVFSDEELIDCGASSGALAQAAIAARPSLSAPVAAALAEIAGPDVLIVMARNAGAIIPGFSVRRMIERHGAEGVLREALLARPDLPAGARVDLVGATTAALARFVTDREWLSDERMQRIARETRDKTSIVISETSRDKGRDLVAQLRQSGRLTVGFALRAILSGKIDLFELVLAELAGIPLDRVAGLVARCGGSGFAALYDKAGLPGELLPAIRIMLRVVREIEWTKVRRAGLSCLMIGRVLKACEAINEGELDTLLVLLRRLESEAAREEFRTVAAPAPRVESAPLMLKPDRPLVLQHAPIAAAAALPSTPPRPRLVVDMRAIEAELLAA